MPQNKWAFKIFAKWQIARVNKVPCIEQRSFKIDIDKVQTLDTNIANMSAETLNFWLTKFVQDLKVVKVNGERYPGRSLYIIVAGLQRHLGESGNAIRLVNQDEARLVKSDYFKMSCILWLNRIYEKSMDL